VASQMRSSLTPGRSSLWAARRAQWRALGLSEEDLGRPKIAIVNSSSELAVCFRHLDAVAARAKESVRLAGGVPLEIRTVAPSDFVTSAGAGGAYILSARDLLSHDIEAQVEGAQLDGMLCLASCDKTTPGQLMAAGRIDVPTLVLPCGYQPCGWWQDQRVDIEDVFERTGRLASGRTTVRELEELADRAISGPGVCSGMGTATSMHLAAEALGMALPRTAAVLAGSQQMWTNVDLAGKRIVELVNEGVTPRSIMTQEAFANAVTAVLAVSGSVNCVKHLQAIASEARVDVDVRALFDDLAPQVPLLAAVRPSGSTTVEQFDAAGVDRRCSRSWVRDSTGAPPRCRADRGSGFSLTRGLIMTPSDR
jgi:dihydroxy-acid dehydratase